MTDLAADPLVPAIWQVTARRLESPDTVTLWIRPEDGPPPAFAPGQFHMLSVFGAGEAAISLSGASPRGTPPTKATHRHTIRAVGAVTDRLFALDEGDPLGVRGPFGHPWPLDEVDGHDVVIVAGGIGLAPLMPVVDAVLADRDRVGRVALLVGTRTPADRLFKAELDELGRRRDVELRQTVDVPSPGWADDVGVVTHLLRGLSFDPLHTTAFVCGPEIMMRFSAGALVEAGVPADRIHLSLERNMKCAVAHCGHCQYGPLFVCREGPVVTYATAAPLLQIAGL